MHNKPRKCRNEPEEYDVCVQCGSPLMDDETYYYLNIGNIAICTKCAEVVANCFNRRHSGAWLTWSEE